MFCQGGISPLRRTLDRQNGLRGEKVKTGIDFYSFVWKTKFYLCKSKFRHGDDGWNLSLHFSEAVLKGRPPCLPLPPMLYLSQSIYFLSQANSWLSTILIIISENLCFSKNQWKSRRFSFSCEGGQMNTERNGVRGTRFVSES